MTDRAKRVEASALPEPIALDPEQLREIASATAGAGALVVAGLGPIRYGGIMLPAALQAVAVE